MKEDNFTVFIRRIVLNVLKQRIPKCILEDFDEVIKHQIHVLFIALRSRSFIPTSSLEGFGASSSSTLKSAVQSAEPERIPEMIQHERSLPEQAKTGGQAYGAEAHPHEISLSDIQRLELQNKKLQLILITVMESELLPKIKELKQQLSSRTKSGEARQLKSETVTKPELTSAEKVKVGTPQLMIGEETKVIESSGRRGSIESAVTMASRQMEDRENGWSEAEGISVRPQEKQRAIESSKGTSEVTFEIVLDEIQKTLALLEKEIGKYHPKQKGKAKSKAKKGVSVEPAARLKRQRPVVKTPIEGGVEGNPPPKKVSVEPTGKEACVMHDMDMHWVEIMIRNFLISHLSQCWW